ncbi:MAG TPA: hypothetical protein VGR96_15760 [Acidobacteriaceae bacterium]|nr:hypothetical protein [Acidobacteriaceae bacterium]
MRILSELSELKGKVDESLEQGRANGADVKLLRKELGLDGPHGRLPLVEATLSRNEVRMDKHEVRLEELEAGEIEAQARHKLVTAALALCGGGAGGAVIGLIGHFFGVR